jgi:nucleotide-binding universal stress UspA family protein
VQVNRVVVGVSGSAGSLTALRYAAGFAWGQQATLMPVLAWLPPGGDLADRRFPCPELRASWRRDAKERLEQAIDLAIGGPPAGIGFEPRVVRGDAGSALAWIAAEPGDLLVVGTGRHGWLRRLVAGRVARYCVGHGRCPVLAVPPGRLADSAHGLRGWMDRHRMQPEDALLDTGRNR